MQDLNVSHSAILMSSHAFSCKLILQMAGKAISHLNSRHATCMVHTCSLASHNTPSLLTDFG